MLPGLFRLFWHHSILFSAGWDYSTPPHAKREYYFSFVINGHRECWSFVEGAVGVCGPNVRQNVFFLRRRVTTKDSWTRLLKKRFVWDEETGDSKWKWRHFEVCIQTVSAHFQQFLSLDPLKNTDLRSLCCRRSQQAVENTAYLIRRL